MRIQLQSEASECGLACLAMIASYYGHHTSLTDLRQKFSVSLKGITLAQLMRHASALSLSIRPLRAELAEIPKIKLPCILHWDLNHFVVLKKITKDFRGNINLVLLDPALGERCIFLDDASQHFTGVALELTPTPSFSQKPVPKKIAIRELIGPIIGLRRAVVQAVILAIALEMFVLAAPIFNQFVIDDVILSADRELLTVLVIGFTLMMLIQTGISLARSWFLMRWSMDISFQWGARVFSHLANLPVSYFEKRYLGEIVSRFGSMGAIQNTLTNLLVESLLDSVMALLAMVMMFLYSPLLSSFIIATIMIYATLRWVFYLPFREASQERLILSSKENSHFIETLRAITPLKLFGREEQRLANWLNLKMDIQNRDIKTQKLAVFFKLSNTAIFGAQSLGVFYFGAGQVISNTLTIGMLMAFASYSSTFSGRIFNLIDLFFNVKVLEMHTERLADIVLERSEVETAPESDLSGIDATITLKDIRFRYAEGEPYVLDGVNLTIPAGQSIAIVGPSGSGKTTLCKIILGLLAATEGEVLVGGLPLSQLSLRSYRQLVGTVMQDDVLLAGSIRDNISFFDPQMTQEKVESCSRLAAIHDEIIAMPMGYHTLVGDMGTSLSGGQKQRVLLARALYKKPKILALDEATSHLDVDNEQKVNQVLQQQKLMRIMIAHRKETIDSADRVVTLSEGKLIETRAVYIKPVDVSSDGCALSQDQICHSMVA
ncbi:MULTISPECIES: peptidase domain-containing ABC transporter [unclassified Janthinobacterium]|uniref:peptidase domain-containing ABC transporter n=1 Tax=unclassified Janthinobacterium TaxID=2610881 RepID=UPI001615D83F|nr:MULTISPECIES: peptidase domain-containing ABC transporter [unclassified Janthinobacterium]